MAECPLARAETLYMAMASKSFSYVQKNALPLRPGSGRAQLDWGV